MSLHHRDPDCTGEWGVRNRASSQVWVCDRCGAIGYLSVATNSEPIIDNVRGQELARLTHEGRKLLEEEQGW